ncbi:hypothetical protein HDU93_009270, partial [Gonapodya sp. JEL0774]
RCQELVVDSKVGVDANWEVIMTACWVVQLDVTKEMVPEVIVEDLLRYDEINAGGEEAARYDLDEDGVLYRVLAFVLEWFVKVDWSVQQDIVC